MTVKASLTPANGVINNKTRWAERREWGRVGLSGHRTSLWAAGADRAAERRDTAWRSWNLRFDICSASESVRGREKDFGSTVTASWVRVSGFIKEIWLAGHREWLSSMTPTGGGQLWMDAQQMSFIQQSQSSSSTKVEGNQPTWEATKKDKIQQQHSTVQILVEDHAYLWCSSLSIVWIISCCHTSEQSPQRPSVSHYLKLHWKCLMQPEFQTTSSFPRKIRTPTMQVPHLTKDVFHYWLSIKKHS